MRVHLTHREHVAELAVYLRGRGFLVVDRGGNKLDVHLLNHVSARSDAIEASGALDAWRLVHPGCGVDESD